jgi:hypothetical protein
MTAGVVNLQFYGDSRQVEQMLDRMNSAISPIGLMSFLGVKVDPYLRSRMEARFADEGDDVTGAWAPLKQVTQDIRAHQGFPPAHPINRRTGELEQYITASANFLGPIGDQGAILRLPGDPPASKSLKKKVTTAQKGDNRTVARPVLGMNEKDLAFVLGALAFHVTDGYGVP